MTVITGLAACHPVDIVAFGESGPDTAMAPFRSAELAETNMREMMPTVGAQPPPFRAAHMASVRLSSGRSSCASTSPRRARSGSWERVPARRLTRGSQGARESR